MDGVDLQAEFRCRVRCLQGVPSFLRGQFRSALFTSLEAMRTAYQSSDNVLKCRNWEVFRLTSRMLLWRNVDQAKQSWRDGWSFSTRRIGRCCSRMRGAAPQGREGSLHS